MRLSQRDFPVAAGVLFGIGLGGFFDGIVLHQLLQWHHVVSSWYPTTNLENLELNTFWDGVFHSATYLVVVAALFVLWRTAKTKRIYWSTRLFVATLLIGFGAFNVTEGLLNHHLLGLHHVNETVPTVHWIYWDLGFLASGLLMLVVGAWLYREGRAQMEATS